MKLMNLKELITESAIDNNEVIEDNAYCNSKIKSIKLSNNLKKIGNNAFKKSNLLQIEIPDSVTEIGESAFSSCRDLKELIFGDNIEILPNACFTYSGIESLKTPKNCKHIGNYAFSFCNNLKEVIFDEKVEVIGSYCFERTQIESIQLPKALKVIEYGAFENCTQLTEVKFNDGLEKINNFAFIGTGIKKIRLPKTLKNIYENSFSFPALKEITLPSEILNIPVLTNLYYGNANIYIGDNEITIKTCENKYEFKNNCYPIVSETPILDYIATQSNKYNYITEKLSSYNLTMPFKFAEMLSENELNRLQLDKFKRVHNLILEEAYLEEDIIAFYKFAYNLGAFSENKELRIEVCNFLKDKLTRGDLNIDEMHIKFNAMKCAGENEEFTKFYIHNYLAFNKEDKDFIAICYNNFERVQAHNTSNKGEQRQKKPTIQFCKKFFEEFNIFEHFDEKEKEIATEIAKFFVNANTYKIAVNMIKEFNNLNIDKSIVKNTENLVDNNNSEFTFEWLNKDDARNFTLGKYCNCCSHLEGAGYSIVRASVLSPDVQNLIIKQNGNIVAKSTLYVNRKLGYAVYNNIEVAKNVEERYKKQILDTYIRATQQFVNTYNEENDIKIVTVTTGLHVNKLAKYLKKDNIMLHCIDYTKFAGDGFSGYAGDAMRNEGQAYIYQDKELMKSLKTKKSEKEF